MRDRLLNAAETVAFGILWFYLLPLALIGWYLYGDETHREDY